MCSTQALQPRGNGPAKKGYLLAVRGSRVWSSTPRRCRAANEASLFLARDDSAIVLSGIHEERRHLAYGGGSATANRAQAS